jgi:hypothetical protein
MSVNQAFAWDDEETPHFLSGGLGRSGKGAARESCGAHRAMAKPGRPELSRVRKFLRVVTPTSLENQAKLTIQVSLHHVSVQGDQEYRIGNTNGMSDPSFFFPRGAYYVNVYSTQGSRGVTVLKEFAVSRPTLLW